jgi:hypothetical protein
MDSVTQASTQFTAAAEHLAAAEPAARRAISAADQWHGAGSDAFRQHLSGVPEALAERPAKLREAAAALDGWAQTLATNKRRTEDLDRTALRLRTALDGARDDLQDKQNALDLASTPTVAASASIEAAAASRRVADLDHQLAGVLQQARDLEREHRTAADQVAVVLSGAPDSPDVARSAFGRSLGGALQRGSGLASSLASALGGSARRPETVPTGAGSALAAVLGGRP